MGWAWRVCVSVGIFSAMPWAPARADSTETILLVRHGEKPEAGLGQLTCQGLNRALALPPIIARDYGTPAAVFAPDPAHQKDDNGIPYDYVRPLATVEPTAISLGLPIHADLAVDDVAGLQQALEQPDRRGSLVLVGWEHRLAEDFARNVLKAHGGDPKTVPKWEYSDYDSIYVIRLAWTGGTATASFEHRRQGLDGLPTTCPH